MNHRGVQRALFRAQLDPGFLARLRAGDAEATHGLGPEELALLRGADERAVLADPGGRRAGQFLANVSGEFPISRGLVRAELFPRSGEFHQAVRDGASLPLAFGRFAAREARGSVPIARALVALECALARARRELRAAPVPGPGRIALAPWAWLEDAPDGTLALAAQIRAALDGGLDWPELSARGGARETLLIRSAPARRPLGLREAEVERTAPALAALLRAALEPATREALAAAASSARDELDPVLDELIEDGVLVAG